MQRLKGMSDLTVVDLLTVDRLGADGVLWSLTRGGDLDANLVHLAPGGAVDAHVNDDVDVLFVGVAGLGSITVDNVHHELCAGTVVAIPKGAKRGIAARATSEVMYLTVHVARPGLRIGR